MRLNPISLFALFASFAAVPLAAANNFHRIDPPEGATVAVKNGPNPKDKNFGIYRTGKPTFEDFEKMVCDEGISETFVLSNNGNDVEEKWNTQELSSGRCKEKFRIPGPKNEPPKYRKPMKVRNFDQNVRKHMLTKGFLDEFDEWVKGAQTAGKKIAFRCNCGCHRTGRLAAYYEMKYMGKSVEEAEKNLYKYAHQGTLPIGKDLYWTFAVGHSLKKQTQALYDYAHNLPCSVKKKFCVDLSTATDSKLVADNDAGEDPDNLWTAPLQKSAVGTEAEGLVKSLPPPTENPRLPAGETTKKGDAAI